VASAKASKVDLLKSGAKMALLGGSAIVIGTIIGRLLKQS
jgi:VIT1/CCC1 family predicted Fe2+/Mn2+ transporter